MRAFRLGPLVLMAAMVAMLAIAVSAQAEGDRQGTPDPLLFSTFVGGGAADWPHATVVGDNGTIYVAGYTDSYDFPTTDGAYQRVTKGNEEVFVIHLSADGSELLWATLIGGSGQDIAWDLAVGIDGRVYVTGITRSSNFPTTKDAYLRTREGGSDAFVVCLAPDGGSLVYSTLLGGEDDDQGYAIEVLADGRAVVAGNTGSMFFPTTNGAYDRTIGGVEDVFVARMSSDGKWLEVATYLGGTHTELEPAMALDGSGNVWVTGSTTSEDFPTTAGLPNDWNFARDVFVTALGFDLARVSRSTVVGQMGSDVPRSIDVGPGGEVLVAGYTHSPEFPDTGPQPGNDNSGNWDAFVLVYEKTLESRDHQWLYGGGNYDVARAARFDPTGLIHVVGYTNSTDFPTTLGSYKPYKSGDNHDIFYMQIDPDAGYATINCTYIGKSMRDFGMGVSLDRWGTAIIVGHSWSPDFPTAGSPYDDTHDGGGDVVVLKYTTDEAPPVFGADTTPGQVGTGTNLTFSIEVTDQTGISAVSVDYIVGMSDHDRRNMEYMEGNGTYSITMFISAEARRLEYLFMAWDILGHLSITETRVVTVVDTLPPELVSDLSPEEGTTGDPFEFGLQVRDNWGVENANVEYGIGDRQANSSMDEDLMFGSNKERWNLTVHLARDSLDPVMYRFHFWDQAGNTVTTSWRTASVIDDEDPVLSEFQVPSWAQPGTTVMVSVVAKDNIGIHEAWVDYYESPISIETLFVDGPFGFTIEAEVPIPFSDGELHVVFHVGDAAGNNASVSGVIPFRDEDAPWMNISFDIEPTTGERFNITWQAGDPSGEVEMWGYYVFGKGHAFEDYTFFPTDGSPTASYSIDIPDDSVQPLYVILVARDVYRNLNQTPPFRIDVRDNDPPVIPKERIRGSFQDSNWNADLSGITDNIGVVLYEWRWTPPGSDTEMVLNSTGPMISVPIAGEGTYTVELYVYDAAGNWENVTTSFVALGYDGPGPDNPWEEALIWVVIIGVAVMIINLDLRRRRRTRARQDGSGET